MRIILFIIFILLINSYAETFDEFKTRCKKIGFVNDNNKNYQKLLAESLYGTNVSSEQIDIIEESTGGGVNHTKEQFGQNSTLSMHGYLYIMHKNHKAKIICDYLQYKKYIQYINNNLNTTKIQITNHNNTLWQNQPFTKEDIRTYNKHSSNSNRVKTYTKAMQYCNNLLLNNRTNWQLPTQDDVNNILDLYGNYKEYDNDKYNKVFVKKKFVENLPSSTTLKFWLKDSEIESYDEQSNTIDFSTGWTTKENKDNHNYVICISK